MSLFQTSVVNKYLKRLDKQAIQTAYATFKTHFHNAGIQENIRKSKEEQYQGEFLIDLFVNVMGYTKNPTPNYNITTEYKNVKDSKKADGAIVFNNVVKAVIELKGASTTDLGNVEAQAFGYKNNQPECVYVIISNFEKLRFYIDNAIEFIEFNLFKLTESEFEILFLCLSLQSMEENIPKKIKEESISREDEITKNLYRDYSLFRSELHANLVAQNPQYDSLTLFKKSQKLLDRFLFLLFAEDRQLLPPNSVRLILNDWRDLLERDEEIPLYKRFKKYFGYLNTGYKGKRYEVYAYNGGLFEPDEILDSILIDDELLYKHSFKLSEYDFASEVDVNILGHIFENSLNELDELKAEIGGHKIDRTKSKRKKDGVFYTPKYITRYIVDNTVGRLCTGKKVQLEIIEEEYNSDKKRQNKTILALADKLNAYRDWLLQITICDPACGSGAFLNQALNFLIDEHRYIDELQAKLFGDSLILSDIENNILENNLFGVDINEESVAIAKLSLWLRTAQPNRKLNDLSNNIKCGNSLIDDPDIAGDKAFNWEKEFPQIFRKDKTISETIVVKKDESPDYLKLIKEKTLEAQEKAKQSVTLSKEAILLSNESIEISKKVIEYIEIIDTVSEPNTEYGIQKAGFDVVIGNPPYGATFNSTEKAYFKQNYKTTEYNYDSYNFFFELSIKLLKPDCYLGFITPNTFIVVENGSILRKFLFLENRLIELFETFNVFPDAVVEPLISIIKKTRPSSDSSFDVYLDARDKSKIEKRTFKYNQITDKKSLIFNYRENDEQRNLYTKIQNGSLALSNYARVTTGIKPYQTGKGVPKQTKEILETKPFTGFTNNAGWKPLIRGTQINRYSLEWNNEYINYGIWLAEPRTPELFFRQKLFIRRTDDRLLCAFDDDHFVGINSVHCIQAFDEKISNKYLLTLINSRLINWFFRQENYHMVGKPMAEVKVVFVERLPIKIAENQQAFIDKADFLISSNKELLELAAMFQRTILRKFEIEELPVKLQKWYLFSYAEFIKELGKKKIKLSLSDEAQWESYFLQEAGKALAIKTQIDITDKETDQLVYALYGLKAEEIAMVEQLKD